MSEKDFKLLMELATQKLQQKVSKEGALRCLINAGILDINGNLTEPYKDLDVIAKGFDVFEEKERFDRWLNKENSALKGAKPLDLLNTSAGTKLVAQLLGRIEEGVFS
jgi:hypothetical protein